MLMDIDCIVREINFFVLEHLQLSIDSMPFIQLFIGENIGMSMHYHYALSFIRMLRSKVILIKHRQMHG